MGEPSIGDDEYETELDRKLAALAARHEADKESEYRIAAAHVYSRNPSSSDLSNTPRSKDSPSTERQRKSTIAGEENLVRRVLTEEEVLLNYRAAQAFESLMKKE